jgi:hypothetical protein
VVSVHGSLRQAQDRLWLTTNGSVWFGGFRPWFPSTSSGQALAHHERQRLVRWFPSMVPFDKLRTGSGSPRTAASGSVISVHGSTSSPRTAASGSVISVHGSTSSPRTAASGSVDSVHGSTSSPRTAASGSVVSVHGSTSSPRTAASGSAVSVHGSTGSPRTVTSEQRESSPVRTNNVTLLGTGLPKKSTSVRGEPVEP